jgi:hypothetical protein
MKLRKRSFIIGGIALLVSGVLSVGLLTGCRPFHGHGPGPHRFCKKDFSEHVLRRMDREVKKLDLSEAQYAQYEDIRKSVAADLAEGEKKGRQLVIELQSELNKENPNVGLITSLLKDQLRGMPDIVEKYLYYFEEFYNILDEDQKVELIQKFRKKMKRCGV